MTTADNKGWEGDDWEEQGDRSPLVKLGDGKGQVLEARGLVTRISMDNYGNPMYHILQSDGSPIRLVSNAGIVNQMQGDVVGELVRVTFAGWSPSSKGGKPFKNFDVRIFRGTQLPAELVEVYPRWRKIAKPTGKIGRKEEDAGPSFADVGSGKGAESLHDTPSALQGDGDDDLPF